MRHTWDPARYLAYADERGRPFVELVARIGATDPRTVVDLGCGPGNLTALLAERWPDASVVGIDSSAEMIAAAQASGSGVRFEAGELREWGLDTTSPSGSGYSTGEGGGSGHATGEGGGSGYSTSEGGGSGHATGEGGGSGYSTSEGGGSVDVLVSNATLQWVPDHLELLPRLVGRVRPGGWIAFQVPGNFDQPSHTIRAELAAEPAYMMFTAGVAVPSSYDATTYLRTLEDLGCEVDAWETTYLHVLHGEDPVFTWVSGTGARPTLQALPDDLRSRFETEFKRRLREAYPDRGHGVVLPFRRIFVVARVPA